MMMVMIMVVVVVMVTQLAIPSFHPPTQLCLLPFAVGINRD